MRRVAIWCNASNMWHESADTTSVKRLDHAVELQSFVWSWNPYLKTKLRPDERASNPYQTSTLKAKQKEISPLKPPK